MPAETLRLQEVEFEPHVRNARYVCPSDATALNGFRFISGYEECTERYDLSRNDYPYLTLEMIIGGSGTLSLNGEQAHVSPGFCFCAGPGAHFRLQSSRAAPLRKYFVAFGGSTQSSIPQKRQLYPGFVYQYAEPAALKKWNELILEEGASQSNDASDNTAALINILIKKITPEPKARAQERAADALVRRALQAIENQFKTLSSLQGLADSLHVSGEHLCRAFKANDRSSPYQILTRRKMEHAYAQLKMTQTPVQDIALSLGFTDAFHFSRAFKKRYGLPPSHIRRT